MFEKPGDDIKSNGTFSDSVAGYSRSLQGSKPGGSHREIFVVSSSREFSFSWRRGKNFVKE